MEMVSLFREGAEFSQKRAKEKINSTDTESFHFISWYMVHKTPKAISFRRANIFFFCLISCLN